MKGRRWTLRRRKGARDLRVLVDADGKYLARVQDLHPVFRYRVDGLGLPACHFRTLAAAKEYAGDAVRPTEPVHAVWVRHDGARVLVLEGRYLARVVPLPDPFNNQYWAELWDDVSDRGGPFATVRAAKEWAVVRIRAVTGWSFKVES